MSTPAGTTTITTTATVTESKYRNMFRPTKLWRNNKTMPMPAHSGEEKALGQDNNTKTSAPSLMKIPTMKMPSPSMPSFGKKTNDNPMVLKETGKNEVYELSTVNDSGVYLPPIHSSKQNNKYDHWLVVDDDSFSFSIPSEDCLTTIHGRPHSFYTPSSVIISA